MANIHVIPDVERVATMHHTAGSDFTGVLGIEGVTPKAAETLNVIVRDELGTVHHIEGICDRTSRRFTLPKELLDEGSNEVRIIFHDLEDAIIYEWVMHLIVDAEA